MGSIRAPSLTRRCSSGGRGCRCPSETPLCHCRAPASPHLLGDPSTAPALGLRRGARKELVAPGRTPKPARPRTDPRTGLAPGSQERCPAARVPPRRAERVPNHFPRELPACVDTPWHIRRGQPPIAGQPSRPVRLRVSPGSVPFRSLTGKLFCSPVAERSRERHRLFTVPRTGTGLCRRRGRGPGTPWHRRHLRLTVLSGTGGSARPPDESFSFPSSSGITGETATGSDLRHRYRTVPPGFCRAARGYLVRGGEISGVPM